MMFEYIGREDGERDGNADAIDHLPKYPRPNLKLSLLSTNYRDNYFNAYHGSYDLQARINRECEFRDRVYQERRKSLRMSRQKIKEKSQEENNREI